MTKPNKALSNAVPLDVPEVKDDTVCGAAARRSVMGRGTVSC